MHYIYVGLISSTNLKIEAINKFILYNMEVTQLWVTLYGQKSRTWESNMKEFKRLNGRSLPYPDHLKENMPMTCPYNNPVVDQVK